MVCYFSYYTSSQYFLSYHLASLLFITFLLAEHPSLTYLVNITLSFCHLANSSHIVHLPIQSCNHLLRFPISPQLSLSLNFPLQPFLCWAPNDFRYFSVCYLLFNNHVSRMCMYIHRQFSAVMMRKSITVLRVCV